MKAGLVFSLLFLVGECMSGADANDSKNNTDVLDGKFLYRLGTVYNNPLLRLIGKTFLNSDRNNRNGSGSQLRNLKQNFSDFQHNISERLCELHPCTEWGSWSACPAKSGQFAIVTRSRNCNKTDMCPQTRPTNLITTESKVCEGSLECPTSYETEGSFCLKFYSSGKSQPGAKTACHNDGGYLVHIDTQIKSDAVTALLDRHGFSSAIWLNGERATVGDPWTFEYGSDPDFENWSSSEPSNGSTELCKVEAKLSGQIVWYDVQCTGTRYFYVCEII